MSYTLHPRWHLLWSIFPATCACLVLHILTLLIRINSNWPPAESSPLRHLRATNQFFLTNLFIHHYAPRLDSLGAVLFWGLELLAIAALEIVMLDESAMQDSSKNLTHHCRRISFFHGLAFISTGVRIGIGMLSYSLGASLLLSAFSVGAFRESSRGLLPLLITSTVALSVFSRISRNRVVLACFSFAWMVIIGGVGIFNRPWWHAISAIVGLLAPPSVYMLQQSFPSLLRFGKTAKLSMKGVLLGAVICLSVILTATVSQQAHKIDIDSPQQTLLANTPADQLFMSIVIMSAPRRGNPDYLNQTIQSFLDALNMDQEDPLYGRIRIIVYTHFSDHVVYDRARKQFSMTEFQKKHLIWKQEPGQTFDLPAHLRSALTYANGSAKSRYIGLFEDDFPLCHNGWQEIMRLMAYAQIYVPMHCGVFVGSGGAGIIFRSGTTQKVIDSIPAYKGAPDVGIQDCLLGHLCKGYKMVVGGKMLMRHLGAKDSTSDSRVYSKRWYQCRCRSPLVEVIHAIMPW